MKIPDCQGPSRESVGSGERSPAFCFFEQVFFMGLGEFGPKCNVFQLKRHVVDKGIIFIYRIDIISERAPLHNVYMPTRGDAFSEFLASPALESKGNNSANTWSSARSGSWTSTWRNSHKLHDTVDGRNPAPLEVGSLVYAIFFKQGSFIHPFGGWPWDF